MKIWLAIFLLFVLPNSKPYDDAAMYNYFSSLTPPSCLLIIFEKGIKKGNTEMLQIGCILQPKDNWNSQAN